ncbi:4-hydroxy-tetrahydrodipicolinate reductase [Fervidibacillus halotolerans]|uniref:4-hydroxy-tetrahydrodipicolinate reductase n=1 Tax=Fervidibacillus halotolerans TaxID=2980027 RepID=A0A9E8M2D1_9BACI|nr:4-hydroxy-tetrahydrodipicolinate reductase [Fervidibacillus halotolerans]WAA13745.1 4-hydroxy-tetrahydrodipicolinate reductase [Fervidibacillus halotolerans]
MNKVIKIVVTGPRGKMGREAIRMITNTKQFQLVGVIDRNNNGKGLSEIVSMEDQGQDCSVFTDVNQCLRETKPDCLLELSVADAAYEHALAAIQFGVRPVIGTTGLSQEQLADIEREANENKIGCIVAPNFAIGAVLMMKFAEMAAKHFPDVEIIEMHHDEKVDAPSGTALKTAEMIQRQRQEKQQGHPKEIEKLSGVRGGDFDGMKIHSIRLPGLVAHQQVLFGSVGETLTIRHDSYNRTSFMTGVKKAVETVMHVDSYIYGLENILE